MKWTMVICYSLKKIGKEKDMEYIKKMIKSYKEVSNHGTDYY